MSLEGFNDLDMTECVESDPTGAANEAELEKLSDLMTAIYALRKQIRNSKMKFTEEYKNMLESLYQSFGDIQGYVEDEKE